MSSVLGVMPPARRWLFSVKLPAWPKLVVPALVGQGLGAAEVGRGSALRLLVGSAFVTAFILYVVWLNDWGDRAIDTLKRHRFPQSGSPKTIPDGVLPGEALGVAGTFAAATVVGLGAWAGRALGPPSLTVGAMACVVVFASYTLPPLRLNYRGGGEFLEAWGVGALLPWLQASLQSGEALPRSLGFAVPLVPLAFASALASGLSDEESDRMGGKRTLVCLLGNARARGWIGGSVVAGWVLALSLVPWAHGLLRTGLVCGVAVGAVPTLRMFRASSSAVTGAYDAQRRFKGYLHGAVWRAGVVWSLAGFGEALRAVS